MSPNSKQREMLAEEKLTLGPKKNNTHGAKNGGVGGLSIVLPNHNKTAVANHVPCFNFRCYEPMHSLLFISSL